MYSYSENCIIRTVWQRTNAGRWSRRSSRLPRLDSNLSPSVGQWRDIQNDTRPVTSRRNVLEGFRTDSLRERQHFPELVRINTPDLDNGRQTPFSRQPVHHL